MVVILQMGLVKANQKQIIKIPWLGFKFWNNGYLQFSLSGELIA